jgi:hypothetical protein
MLGLEEVVHALHREGRGGFYSIGEIPPESGIAAG